jgi:cytoskeletal protein RodZ
MPPEEINFQTFFTAKLKERGVSLKKLSEATGIAPSHLDSMVHGKFDDLPSSPYLHGYILRLGKALDFDGDAWWEKIKKEGLVKDSGPTDALPSNRFLKKSPTKFIWIGVVIVLILLYLAFQLPIIFSKPKITITFPDQNPYTTSSSTLTIEGTTSGANSLALNGDVITIAPDGSWQKTVLLQNGPNSFDITANKLLGGGADVTEQIFYQGGTVPTAPTSTSISSSTASSTPSSTKK